METSVFRVLVHPDRKRRVKIVRWPNGHFGFEEEKFILVGPLDHEELQEWCWIPCSASSFSICDSPDTAEREASGRISWLQEQGITTEIAATEAGTGRSATV